MGFHKRFITKYHILENIDRIEEFLDADALILDSWSSNFVNDLNKEEEVLRETIKSELKLSSGCPSSHPKYHELDSLSETLISLNLDPTWLDVHFTKSKLNIQTALELSGKFEEQVELCKSEIIKYYDINGYK